MLRRFYDSFLNKQTFPWFTRPAHKHNTICATYREEEEEREKNHIFHCRPRRSDSKLFCNEIQK